jgi:kinesin family protein 13
MKIGTSGKYADQEKVYSAVGKSVLDNAWQGYHCCLFAYGQTGSGKSYSMIGFGTNRVRHDLI